MSFPGYDNAYERAMIRILYVHHGKGIGGAPLSLLYLIRGLDRSVYEPTVLCVHESEAADLFRSEGIETIVLPKIKDFSHTNVLWYPWWQFPKIIYRFCHLPFAIERLRRYFNTRRFDILHLNTSTLLAFGIAGKRAGMKVAWHIREPLSRGYFGFRRAIVRRIIDKNADAIIPICKYDADQLIPSDRISVVYNFIDFDVFNPEISGERIRNELGFSDQTPVIIMLGGINAIKGTYEFVDAAVQVLKKKPDTVFLVAGAIPEKTFRNKLNRSLTYLYKVQSRIPNDCYSSIRFLGVRQDIPELLAASTILCFPSTVPHFARPVIEASAMGVPVIASDLGGPQELVQNGKTGFLVPAGDSKALAASISTLLGNTQLAKTIGQEGFRFAREHFDSEKNIHQVLHIYKNLMESN